jgi:hypothetical protein
VDFPLEGITRRAASAFLVRSLESRAFYGAFGGGVFHEGIPDESGAQVRKVFP